MCEVIPFLKFAHILLGSRTWKVKIHVYLLMLVMDMLFVLLQVSEVHLCQSGLQTVPGFAEKEIFVHPNTIYTYLYQPSTFLFIYIHIYLQHLNI